MRLAVIGSTNGTDLVPIVGAIRSGELLASVEVIISNNELSGILKKASDYGIEGHFICHKNKKRDVFDLEMSQILEGKKIDLILLVGFMRILSSEFVERWRGKIINVHPSLLPKYGGKGMFGINVHKAVIENNEEYSGFTIHYVNKNYDEGDIIFQKKIIINTENPLDLAKKILVEEHKYYPQIIENILNES